MESESVCHDLLIVNNCSVSFKNFFRLLVKFAGHFMDLVFLVADSASHPYSPAHAMYFKFFGTFFTFHGHFN